MSKHAHSSHPKKKVEWDLKRILSTIFVTTISALLVFFFIASDAISSCGGGQSGRPLLARYEGGRIYLGDEELAGAITRLQEQNRDANSKELAKTALNQVAQARIFAAAARRFGLPVTDETRGAFLRSYLETAKISPEQFRSASRNYQREVIASLEGEYTRRALQMDIMAAGRATRLGMRIDSEVQAMKTAIDAVSLDLRTLLEGKNPSNDELRTWFESQKGIRGDEPWRRATSFETLTADTRTSLIESWKKANAAVLLMGAVKEMDDKMKLVEDAVKAGKSLDEAARSAGLPLVQSDFFAFGESPKSGDRAIPVNRDFFRQLAGVATGSTSPLIKISGGGESIPQAMLIFRVRERRTIPDYDPILVSDKAAFEKLPKPEQDRIRDLMRTQLKRIEEQTRYALFNDFFTSLWSAANFTIIEKTLDQL